MEYGPDGGEITQNGEAIVDGFAAVDDDRPGAVAGELELGREDVALAVARGEVVMIIQTHLAQGDDGAVAFKLGDPLQISLSGLAGMMRMNADGAADLRMRMAERDGALGIGGIGADGDKPADAGLLGA